MRQIAIVVLVGLLTACATLKTQDAQIIEEVRPVYPEAARLNRTEGRVIIEYTINKEGVPVNYEIVEATPPGVFEAAALAALTQWRYEPARRRGRPVAVPENEAVFVFKLTDEERQPPS